jgi:hypothetical protein
MRGSKDDHHEGTGEKKWYPGKYMSKLRRSSTAEGGGDTGRPSSVERGDFEYEKVHPSGTSDAPVATAVAHVEATPSQPHTTYLSGNVSTAKAIATVEVKLLDVKYLTIQNPKVTIELDGIASTFSYAESHLPIEKSFAVLDITSDIRIEFRGLNEKGQPAFGVIIVPLVTLLNFFGSPLPPKPEWRMLFPWYENLKTLRKNVKFRSGFADVPGSAMTKPSPFLGFVRAEFSLVTPTKSSMPLYFIPSPSVKSAAHYEEDGELSENAILYSNARLQRDTERVRGAIFSPPASVSVFMSIPEIFIPITVSPPHSSLTKTFPLTLLILYSYLPSLHSQFQNLKFLFSSLVFWCSMDYWPIPIANITM